MDTRVEDTPTVTATTSRNFSPEKLVEDIKNIIQRAEEKAVERAKAADRVIRDHPYQTVGIAFGLGLLIGFLAGRR